MQVVGPLEKMLVEDGIKIIKFWFSITIEEQKKRLDERKTNPLQQWKLSTVDAVAQQKWDDYTYYKTLMFQKTATDYAPWVVIEGNVKDTARLEAMRYVLNHNEYPGKGSSKIRLEEDPEIITVLKSEADLVKLGYESGIELK